MRENKSPEDVRYRYGYQGQYAEKDEETGWNHFELREYDAIIGRFTSVDPARQFYSSYIGMGNDPVNGIDPDGGTTFDQGINLKGEIVYDNGINNGNVFLVNEGYTEKITSLDQLISNSTQVVKEWVWQDNNRISILDFARLQTSFAYPGMDFGKKENWSVRENPGKNGLAVSGSVTWGKKDGKGFVGLSTDPRGVDITYNPGQKNLLLGNIYNLRSALSHEGFHLYQRTLIPSSGKYFDTVKDARNWVEKNAVKYQIGNKWWGKVNFQSPTWPTQKLTKEQWANSY
jgi:RHS repeat-associated protein